MLASAAKRVKAEADMQADRTQAEAALLAPQMQPVQSPTTPGGGAVSPEEAFADGRRSKKRRPSLGMSVHGPRHANNEEVAGGGPETFARGNSSCNARKGSAHKINLGHHSQDTSGQV